MNNQLPSDLLINEKIMPIMGYEGLYSVSSFGRVWAHERYVNTPNGKKIKHARWVNPIKIKSGYLQVNLSVNQARKSVLIHRLVANSFIDNPENKYSVNHIDANKTNNNVANLEWATQQEQINHSLSLGLQKFKKGAEHHSYGKKPWNYISNKPIKIKKPNARTMLGKTGKLNPCSKSVRAFTKINNLGEFENIRIASDYFGITSSSISAACIGKRLSAGKYNGEKIHWEYITNTIY